MLLALSTTNIKVNYKVAHMKYLKIKIRAMTDPMQLHWVQLVRNTLNGKYTSEQAIHHSNQQNITIT